MTEMKQDFSKIKIRNLAHEEFMRQLSLCIQYKQTKKPQLLEEMSPVVKKHIEKFGPEQTESKMSDVWSVINYIPKNMSLFDLLEPDSDLYNINGKFCTFDHRLSKIIKEPYHVPKANRYLDNKLQYAISLNAEETWENFLEVYKHRENYLDINQTLVQDKNQIYSYIFTTISKTMATLTHRKYYPTVNIVTSWKQAPKYAKEFIDTPFPRKSIFVNGDDMIDIMPYKYEIYINTESVLNAGENEEFEFIVTKFLYEHTHFIDTVDPSCSVLGEQVMNFYDWEHFCCNMTYFDYLSSAAEKNAQKVAEFCENNIKNEFWLQNNKRGYQP